MGISAINLGHTGNIGRGIREKHLGKRSKVVGYLRKVTGETLAPSTE